MFRSLSSRILVGFLIVATVPVIAVALLEGRSSRQLHLASARLELRRAAIEYGERLDRRIARRRSVVSLASHLLDPSLPLGGAAHQRALDAVHQEFPEMSTIAIFDSLGILRAVRPAEQSIRGAVRMIGRSFAGREYFVRAMHDTSTVTTSVYRGRGFGNRVMVGFGRALRDHRGRVRGVLQASVDVSQDRPLGNALRESTVGYLVTDGAGVVVTRSGAMPVSPLDTLTDEVMRERWGTIPPAPDGAVAESTEWMLASARTANGWRVIVERRMADVMVGSRDRRASAVRATALALALGIVITLILLRSVRDPLQMVMEWLRRFDVRVGRSPAELPLDAPSEIREVVGAMDVLGARLRTSYAELERALAERQTLNLQLNGVLRELDARVAARTAGLQEALRKAEEASVTKSRFLANMSHELRTPLNSVIGFAGILLKNREGRLASPELDLLARIAANGRHLLSLINDILDISKIEAGRMALDVDDVDIVVLAHDVLAQLEGQVGGKPVRLRYDGPAVAPMVRTDGGKLRQILINLLGNAIKFTEQGEVLLRVETGYDGNVTAIAVRDTGIGVPRDRLEAIFLPFEQGDTSTSRRFGGTGLGLAISRSLSEMLGGALAVESREGEGSTFRVILGDLPAEDAESGARVRSRWSPRAELVG